MLNFFLTAAVIAFIALFIRNVLKKKPGQTDPDEVEYTIASMLIFIKAAMQDEVSLERIAGLDDDEYIRSKARAQDLRKALRTCMHANLSSKMYVKSYMNSMLIIAYDLKTENNVNRVIPFDRDDKLSVQDKFEILLFWYGKKFRKNALSHMIKEYELDKQKTFEDGTRGYRITPTEIKEIYEEQKPQLTINDKIEIVVQRVYQLYKGLGVVDELLDQNIDGVNGGTSGVPEAAITALDLDDYLGNRAYIPKAHDAVWMYYKGKSVHMSFLTFGTDLELQRVCNNIYTYGSPGQLNESRGYIINELADGSRVVTVRPKFADSWAFFVRKFNDSLVDIEELITLPGSNILIGWLKYMSMGYQTCIYTGQQGTGKTTLMKAAVKFIDGFLNIRVQEGSSFELWLRRAFPWRNILTFRETDRISGATGLVVQKKTDGAVNLVGEIADDQVAGWAMKAAQVASLFTWATHHAQTLGTLIYAMRDALVATGQFSNEKLAEEYVAGTIKFNWHLVNFQGFRYTERVSECVPLAKQAAYPEDYLNTDDLVGAFKAFTGVFREYAHRSTDRKSFEENVIIKFQDGAYVPVNRPTDAKIMDMISKMEKEDSEKFLQFLDEHWGVAS
jgi:pilus assembly protein CpaF